MKKKANTKANHSDASDDKSSEQFIIYHNSRCSKSREACSILEKNKIKFETIEYLKTPPTPVNDAVADTARTAPKTDAMKTVKEVLKK